MAKKPIKYFRIAQAIAQLSGRTEHEVLCQIFEGCSYGSGSSFGAGENWNAIRWGKLTTLIQLMSGSVMARAKTDSYWQTALMVTGAHDPASGELQHSTEPLDSLGVSFGLIGTVAHPADIPPVPSALLAEVELSETPIEYHDLSGVSQELSIFLQIGWRLHRNITKNSDLYWSFDCAQNVFPQRAKSSTSHQTSS